MKISDVSRRHSHWIAILSLPVIYVAVQWSTRELFGHSSIFSLDTNPSLIIGLFGATSLYFRMKTGRFMAIKSLRLSVSISSLLLFFSVVTDPFVLIIAPDLIIAKYQRVGLQFFASIGLIIVFVAIIARAEKYSYKKAFLGSIGIIGDGRFWSER